MARKTRNQRRKAANSSSPQKGSGLQNALTTYRPIIDGILFVLSIVGVMVTVHLWIQQEIVQFSQGCWGFNPPAGGASASSDCALVAQSDAGKLFGISNVYWGIGFYIVLSVLGFMVARASAERVSMLKKVRAGLIAFGFFFSLYLVNVQLGFVEEGLIAETCKLCMTSAAIAALLFVTMLIDVFTSGKAAGIADESVQPSKLYPVLPIVALLLLGGDFAWFQSKASSTETAAAAPTTVQNASASEQTEAGAEGATSLSCAIDPRYDPIPNYRTLLSPSDPAFGPADAAVTVIEYFDPNCPHCQALHPVMKEVIDKYQDRVRFVYKPYALGQASVAQIEAMYVAKEQGKFSEMLDAQMALKVTRGLPLDQIRTVASDIGMDVSLLNSRLRAQMYRSVVMAVRETAATANLSSVPAVIINGKILGTRSQECIEQFIEAEL